MEKFIIDINRASEITKDLDQLKTGDIFYKTKDEFQIQLCSILKDHSTIKETQNMTQETT